MASLPIILEYFNSLKNTFLYQPKKYTLLLQTWTSFNSKKIDFPEFMSKFSLILSDYPNLIKQFNYFLPKNYGIKFTEDESKKDNHLYENINMQKNRRKRKSSQDINDQNKKRKRKVRDFCCADIGIIDREDLSNDSIVKKEINSKLTNWKNLSFFDKVDKLLDNEECFLNFLKCFNIFNKNLINKAQLYQALLPFVMKSPNLKAELMNLLKLSTEEERILFKEKIKKGSNYFKSQLDIDYSSLRKFGESYRCIKTKGPQSNKSTKKSRSTNVKVLNSEWASFPMWSEVTTFAQNDGSNKITAIEESFYKCEDERFELDIVIDNISWTIEILEGVQKQMEGLSPDELAVFKLDERLGGTSEILQRKSIERIYGVKSSAVISGMMQKPSSVVPIVLRRLKVKRDEWNQHKLKFNETWKRQVEKHNSRLLTYELNCVKQKDHREARYRTLINQAQAIKEECKEILLNQSRSESFNLKEHQIIYSDLNNVTQSNEWILKYLQMMTQLSTNQKETEDCMRVYALYLNLIEDLLYIDQEVLDNQEDIVMFGSGHLYALICLHNRFCGLLANIQVLSEELNADKTFLTDLNIEDLKEDYSVLSFISGMLMKLNKGAIETTAYEEYMRKNLNPRLCNLTLSLDRYLNAIIKELQQLKTNDSNKELLKYFLINNNFISGYKKNYTDKLSTTSNTDQIIPKKVKIHTKLIDSDGELEIHNDKSINGRDNNANATKLETHNANSLIVLNNYVSKDNNCSSKMDYILVHNNENGDYIKSKLDRKATNEPIEIKDIQSSIEEHSSSYNLKSYHMMREYNNNQSKNKYNCMLYLQYRQRAVNCIKDDHLFKIIFKGGGLIKTELIDINEEQIEKKKFYVQHKWYNYIESYCNTDDSLPSLQEIKSDESFSNSLPLFLKRNIRNNKKAYNSSSMIGSSNIIIEDNIQCRFNANSYRLNFINNSYDFLYRPGFLKAAKESSGEMSMERYRKFSFWFRKKTLQNVLKDADIRFNEWMVGPKTGRMKIVYLRNRDTPPYRTYRKYIKIL